MGPGNGIHIGVQTTHEANVQPGTQPLILAVLEDLFFGIKISEAAKKAGARLVMAKTPEAFWARVADKPALIVFDLTCQAMEPLELLHALRQPEYAGLATLGYLPHVQEGLRQQALAAGCARVMPRSAFSSQVEALILEAVGTPAP